MYSSKKIWQLLLVVILVVIALASLAWPVSAQQPQGDIGVYWTDPAVITGALVLGSDAMTVNQYLDFEVRQGAVVISSTEVYLGGGYAAAGEGLAQTVMYDFDLTPGTYDLYARIRVEVEAENLVVGYGSSEPQETGLRTFYGILVDGGAVVPADAAGFALYDTYIVDWLYYYLPIIYKAD